jgi:superfamily II DNA or RNA helicase
VRLTPRSYQREGLDAITTALLAGINRQLLQAPTGTGKTVTFAELLQWPGLAAWLQQFPSNERHMLVIAHRKELLDQAAEKIQRANPTLVVTIDQGNRRASLRSDVVVASIQSLAASGFGRLQRLLSAMTFRVVVVDEAHHSAARTYREALALLEFLPNTSGFALNDAIGLGEIDVASLADVALLERAMKTWDTVAPRDRLLLGVTATPNRSDAIGLNCVFEKLVYSYRLKDAIKDGWLVPIVPYAIETDTSLDDVRTNRGEFVQSALSEAVNTGHRNALALSAWVELAEHLPTIVFSVDVAHAHALADTWVEAGYTAKAISGKTPDDERRETLRAFAAGELDAVMNCMVLTEGTDLPIAACILHAKPTKSATLYEQMTGRGLRPLPGDPVGPPRATFTGALAKPHCVLIDIVDVARRHSLQTAPVLYGLPPGVVPAGKALDQVELDLEKLREEFPGFDVDSALVNGAHLTLEQLRARAELVDLWRVPTLPVELGSASLRWMKAGDDIYQVEYPWNEGYERLRVEKDLLDRWSITLRVTAKEIVTGKWDAVSESVIGSQITTVADAVGLSEAFVREQRTTIAYMKNKDAPWRLAAASQKQLFALRRRRIPFSPTVTKGQASDLLDLATSRRR